MRSGSASRGWSLGLCVVLLAGCTTLAGIDDEYIQANPTTAARGGVGGTWGGTSGGEAGTLGTAGSFGAAGTLGSGGSAGSEGSAGSGGSSGTAGSGSGGTAGMTCPAGQKFCNGECTLPRPLVGCALDSCERCTAAPPENSHAICADDACSFECDIGFVPNNGRCLPADGGMAGTAGASGTAGSTGTGGSGGGVCVPTQCPGCIPHGPFGCCLSGGRGCGCTWAPGAVCYPG